MKILVILVLQAILIIGLISQIIVPFFTKDLELFWFFKRKKAENSTPDPMIRVTDLDELESNAVEATETYKKVLTDLDETQSKVNEIKEKTKI